MAEENIKTQIENRSRIIIRTSIIGIIANVFLAAFKAAVGIFTHSIAIVLDAVNNLSDALSSLITIIGAKLAGKEPDKKHPFGHGRVEYISAMLIAMIVLYAGLTSLIESIKKIFNPETPEYTVASLIIVAVAVVVKIVLGRYVKSVGEKVNSDSLVNSGEDASLDAIISASTLVAALIFIITGYSLEAYLGVIISGFIIKAGIEMLQETISKILGEKGDLELANAIKATVRSHPGVMGAYDLVLNNYGPDTYNGSIHIEIPDTFDAVQIDEMIREITMDVLKKHNVILTAVGVYSVNTKDPEAVAMREDITKIALSHEYVNQIHGFFVNPKDHTMRFDVVISYDAPDRFELFRHVSEDVKKAYPDYKVSMIMDTDFAEA